MGKLRHFRLKLAVLLALLATVLSASLATPDIASPEQIKLGERLFREPDFSTPRGDLPASCASCHLFDEDPQGQRAFTDFFNRSWISYREQSPQRFELRNSPTLLDLDGRHSYHFDGEFSSLEALVRGTFTGRPMGWLPGETSTALALTHKVLLQKPGYLNQFRAAFDADISTLSDDQAMDLVARAIAAFLRTLKSPMNSPYDKFIRANGFEAKPATGESPNDFGRRLLDSIARKENDKTLVLPKDFTKDMLAGLKGFMDSGAGNCVICHAPPYFTDNSFHNLGISQVEYDRVHGDGAFQKLAIPRFAKASRPVDIYRQYPVAAEKNAVDLGYWNFADPVSSPLRGKGETPEGFLERMVGAMKTPGLRNLRYSNPYMHNGAYTSLADTVEEIRRLSELARANRVRSADAELSRIRISEDGVRQLAAFLDSLSENLAGIYRRPVQ